MRREAQFKGIVNLSVLTLIYGKSFSAQYEEFYGKMQSLPRPNIRKQ